MMDFTKMYHVAKADFMQRSRTYHFFITHVITIYLACLFIPDSSSQYATLMINGHRGIYTTGWIGISVAISTSLFLGLFGFYLVKNTISRDEETKVGQLFAASPTRNGAYIMGKALSNLIVLSSMVLSAIAASVLMFFLRGESKVFMLWDLISPFLIVVMPTLLMVSAVAILFEIIPWLKGSLGNVAYFFLWTFALVMPTALIESGWSPAKASFVDVFGLQEVTDIIQRQMPQLGNESEVNIGLITTTGNKAIKLFDWSGIHWTLTILESRALWIGIGILLVGLSTLLFSRFKEGGAGSNKVAQARGLGKHKGRMEPLKDKKADNFVDKHMVEGAYRLQIEDSRGYLLTGRTFWRILMAELKIMLKGLNKWWYAGIVTIAVIEMLAPLDFALKLLLPLSWIFPISIWSAMGIREARHNTEQIVFSCFGSLKFQFAALYISGVLTTMLCGSGVLIRSSMTGDYQTVLSWCVAAFFIPAMALLCGIISGSTRLFEILYLVIWYIGPMNQNLYLDFMGVTAKSYSAGMPLVYGGLAIVMVAIAAYKRKLFQIG